MPSKAARIRRTRRRIRNEHRRAATLRALPEGDRLGRAPRSARPQVAEKVEVQEALPPAGVLGVEPLSRYTLTARSAG